MDFNLLLSFLGASILLTVMPGPDNIFVLTESITKGKRNGIALSAGLSTGVLVHTLAAATGLSIIIQNSALAFQVIKYLGAAYLFYLAFLTLKEKPQNPNFEKVEANYDFWKLAKTGFVMNVLNPKVSLFFIAFLPQFVSETGIHITLQMMVLGVIFMIQAFLIFSLFSILSGRLSTYLNNERFWKATKYGKASILALLGLALVVAEK